MSIWWDVPSVLLGLVALPIQISTVRHPLAHPTGRALRKLHKLTVFTALLGGLSALANAFNAAFATRGVELGLNVTGAVLWGAITGCAVVVWRRVRREFAWQRQVMAR